MSSACALSRLIRRTTANRCGLVRSYNVAKAARSPSPARPRSRDRSRLRSDHSVAFVSMGWRTGLSKIGGETTLEPMARPKPPAPATRSPDEIEHELYEAMRRGDLER